MDLQNYLKVAATIEAIDCEKSGLNGQHTNLSGITTFLMESLKLIYSFI